MAEFLTVCEQAARAGGDVLRELLGRVGFEEKGRSDLVTEADRTSQQVIRRTVLEHFPDHAFLGEETLPESEPAEPARNEYRWIADPLDGTTNYVHQVPHFSVSLALEHAGEVLVGVVFNPVSGECFTAAAGEGAWLNRSPIRTSRIIRLSDALAAVGLPAGVQPESPDLRLFLATIYVSQGLRRTGSNALNMSYVACGRYDAAWSYSTKIWDIAAGALLVREAGGVVIGPDGGPLRLENGRYMAAANQELLAQLRQVAANAGL
jgi:myo-inositol-1(or 4)-monophosphatase